MQRLCVYCGSNKGASTAYAEAARDLAGELVERGIGLVYGGASRGIMGVVADAVLAGGGEVIGVMPRALDNKEIKHPNLTRLEVVETMHERKSMMANMADGFVALPGGFGTLEEIVEIITWSQLQFHAKPCGLLNVRGYYDNLVRHIDHAVSQEFVLAEHRDAVIVEAKPAELLDRFESYSAPTVKKWLKD